MAESPLRLAGSTFPSTDTWTATTMTNAPLGRSYHTAVWTGHEMIVWGGFAGGGDTSTGGRYNPGANSWTATSTTNAPNGRSGHTAVWSGSEMIVWGGQNTLQPVGDTTRLAIAGHPLAKRQPRDAIMQQYGLAVR